MPIQIVWSLHLCEHSVTDIKSLSSCNRSSFDPFTLLKSHLIRSYRYAILLFHHFLCISFFKPWMVFCRNGFFRVLKKILMIFLDLNLINFNFLSVIHQCLICTQFLGNERVSLLLHCKPQVFVCDFKFVCDLFFFVFFFFLVSSFSGTLFCFTCYEFHR